MPTLADIYEEQAEECIRSAARADDPKRRDLLLKLASAAKGCKFEARCGRRAKCCTCACCPT